MVARAVRDDGVRTLLDRAAALLRDYGLQPAAAATAIVAATGRAARAWEGDDLAALDPDTDSSFVGAVLDELQIEAQRRAH